MIYQICEQIGINIDRLELVESDYQWFPDGFKIFSDGMEYLAFSANDDIQQYYLQKLLAQGNIVGDECGESFYVLEDSSYFKDCYYVIYKLVNNSIEAGNISCAYTESISESSVDEKLIDEICEAVLDNFPNTVRDSIRRDNSFQGLRKQIRGFAVLETHTEISSKKINQCVRMDYICDLQPVGYREYISFLEGKLGAGDVPYFDVQAAKYQMINFAYGLLASEYNCSLELVKDMAEAEECLAKVEPNFIYNRFDIRFKKNNYVLMLLSRNVLKYIPIHIEGDICFVGIWMTNIRKNEMKYISHFIFKQFHVVYKIKVDYSVAYMKGLILSNHWKVVLPSTEEEFLSKLGKSSRKNIKYYQHKLEKEGSLEFKSYADSDIPDDIVIHYFKYKALTHGSAYKLTPKEYLRKYYVTDAYVLLLDGEIQAVNFWCVTDNNAYCENMTYNEKLRNYRIGNILYYHSIVDLLKRGIKALYLGDGKYEYKKHYGGENRVAYCGFITRDNAGASYAVRNFWYKYCDKIRRRISHYLNNVMDINA